MKTRQKQSRVRAGILAGLAFMLAFSVSAGTKKWTGLGDGVNWSDPQNWDANGVPVTENNDIVYLYGNVGNTANTINNDISGLVIHVLRFEGSADITLNGNALTFANDGADQPRIVSLVNGSEEIDLDLSVVSGTSLLIAWQNWDAKPKDYRRMVFNGVIGGEGGVQYRQNGNVSIEIRGHNTYTGGTDILKGGGVFWNADLGVCDTCGFYAYTTDAFGSVKTVNVCQEENVTLRFVQASGTVDYDLVVKAAKTLELSVCGSATFSGDVTAADYSGQTMRIITSNYQYAPVFSGDITLPGGTLQLMAATYGTVTLSGNVTCQQVRGGANYYGGKNGKFVLSGTSVDCDELFMATTGIDLSRAGILPSDAVIQFKNVNSTLNNLGCFLDLKGCDQTINRAFSYEDAKMGENVEIKSTGGAATLTMNATDNAMLGVPVNGNVSLVWNSAAGKTLTLRNAAGSTAGSLTVNGGTMTLDGTATFANVPSVTVGAGATFQAGSTVPNALASAKTITVGAGGTISFGSTSTSPLPTTGVTVYLDTTATLNVGSGIALQVAKLYVNGQPVDGGTYTGGGAVSQITGSGTVTVESTEVPTKPANWVAGGSDAKVSSLANWDSGVTSADLLSGGLYPTFAQSGTEAIVDGPVGFKGIVFDIPGGQEENAFSLTGVGPISLYNLGITVATPKTDEKYAYALDVPTTLKKPLTIDLSDDADVTLALKKPMSGPFAVETTGAGTLRLEAESPNLAGNFALGCGKVVVTAATNAFGSAQGGGKIIFDQAKTKSVRLYDTTIVNPIDWTVGTAADTEMIYAVEGTNVVTGPVTMLANKNAQVTVAKSAVLDFAGGISQEPTTALTFIKNGQGTLRISGPCQFNQISSASGWVELNTTEARRKTDPSVAPTVTLWGGNLRFGVAYALNSAYSQFYYGSPNATVDLNGCDQYGGAFAGNGADVLGTLTSPTPATYTMYLTANAPLQKIQIAGAASVVVSGPATVDRTMTIDRTATTTGSLTVSNATVTLTANATWLNPTNGAVVVGGVRGGLTVSQSGTFSKKMDFVLGGTAKLTLAAGVTQRCAHLYLDGSTTPAASGTWGATGSGARNVDDVHFAGTGVLKVSGDGLSVIIR